MTIDMVNDAYEQIDRDESGSIDFQELFDWLIIELRNFKSHSAYQAKNTLWSLIQTPLSQLTYHDEQQKASKKDKKNKKKVLKYGREALERAKASTFISDRYKPKDDSHLQPLSTSNRTNHLHSSNKEEKEEEKEEDNVSLPPIHPQSSHLEEKEEQEKMINESHPIKEESQSISKKKKRKKKRRKKKRDDQEEKEEEPMLLLCEDFISVKDRAIMRLRREQMDRFDHLISINIFTFIYIGG